MTRVYFWAGAGLTLLMLLVSAAAYTRLPEEIPVHWNIRGEVDGYGAKHWAAFLVPGIMSGMLILFPVLDWLSPKQFKIDSFRSTYYFVMLVLLGLFGYIHALMLWAALDRPLDTSRAIIGGMCLFFAVLGNVLGKVRRNFWMGVRTPWTIASERVWNDTHRLAARLFVAAGLLGFVIALIAPFHAVTAMALFSLIMIAALVPVVYSLVRYKRLERQGEL